MTIDVGGGDEARNKGMARTAGRNKLWLQRYMALLPRIPVGMKVTAEDVRFVLQPAIGDPTTYHTWGAAANSAARKYKLLEPTGIMVKPRATKSHSRKIQQYVRI